MSPFSLIYQKKISAVNSHQHTLFFATYNHFDSLPILYISEKY